MSRTRKQIIEGFRRLADLLEANPEMPVPCHGTVIPVMIWCDTKPGFAAAVKAFGPGTKADGNETMNFTPDFPLNLTVYGYKETCCVKKVIGKKMVLEEIIPAKEQQIIPAHEVEIVEWECAPFLKTETRAAEVEVEAGG